MLILTAGMYYWRIEQFSLNEHLQKRERLFREHKPYDRVTQLSDADYLRLQIRLEKENHPAAVCSVVLLDINSFHQINRQFGQHEGDRVLQAVSHMLLLNLRNEDVLCRYAGDRFAIVMPETTVADADELAKHLCQMVQECVISQNASWCGLVCAIPALYQTEMQTVCCRNSAVELTVPGRRLQNWRQLATPVQHDCIPPHK
jgi:diguanylate cyclase (GGDEF)-like protein